MYSPRIAYLEHALATKTPFVCYRLPNEPDFYTLLLDVESSCVQFRDFETVIHKKGVLFTPFLASEKTPSFLLTPTEVCKNDKGFRGDMFLDKTIKKDISQIEYNNETKENYQEEFDALYNLLQQKELDKVVLSRTITYSSIDERQPIYTFHNLAKSYKNAFVYWIFLPPKGIVWMGATPELLLKEEANNDLLTMSLAGTKIRSENWTQKEKEEQNFVTQYLQDILMDYELEISETETIAHGDIEHLRNYFKIKNAKNSLPELVSQLHPTPAICGIPKRKALQTIEQIEGHSREYYCGLIGILNMPQTAMFVNLRCMKIAQNKLQLFVGGGLTTASVLEKEWQETERKADTLRKSFN